MSINQSTSLNFINTNFQSYIDIVNRYVMVYPTNMKQNAINGYLQDSFWKEIDHHNLQSEFNGLLTGRIFVFNNEKIMITNLLK
tara:strand:+ start:644 stop:895 length:252 start_codon:yes stop_codon:yes gene_type:complete